VEDLGAEIIAYLESDAVPIVTDEVREIVADADVASLRRLVTDTKRGRARVVARLTPATTIEVGDDVRLRFDPDKLHVFDPHTGAAIEPASIERPSTTPGARR
jgi:multiple sugar transport system ATP-binding protein